MELWLTVCNCDCKVLQHCNFRLVLHWHFFPSMQSPMNRITFWHWELSSITNDHKIIQEDIFPFPIVLPLFSSSSASLNNMNVQSSLLAHRSKHTSYSGEALQWSCLSEYLFFVPKDSSFVVPSSVVKRILSLLQAPVVVGVWTENRKIWLLTGNTSRGN